MTKRAILTHDDVNSILDACRLGDHITVTRTNGGTITSTVSGPVLYAAPDLDKAVGIDLLDGAPHIVRRPDGTMFGEFVSVEVQRPGAPTPAIVQPESGELAGDGVMPWDAAGMMRWAADHMHHTEDGE